MLDLLAQIRTLLFCGEIIMLSGLLLLFYLAIFMKNAGDDD